MYGNNGEYDYCLWSFAARSIMFGSNGEYDYCLWSFAARSIMFGNNGEYDYCLWSFARVVLCSATTVSMNIVFGLSRAEVRGAERRKQPKAARQEGSLVRCHFDRAYSIMFGNKSGYEYCLWSFARELASGVEKSSLCRKDRFLDYAARKRPKASEIHANVAARKTTRALRSK